LLGATIAGVIGDLFGWRDIFVVLGVGGGENPPLAD
jgi:predicted MFS family arabinose efflux permease